MVSIDRWTGRARRWCVIDDDNARAPAVWSRSFPFWDAYHGMVLVAGLTAVGAGDAEPWRRVAATALLLLIGAAYVPVGRGAIRAEPPVPAGLRYTALVVPLFSAAVLLAPNAAVLLASLVPQFFMSLRTPHAVAALVLATTAPLYRLLRAAGADPFLLVLATVLVIAASALLGVFVGRLGEQNLERLRLIGELDRTREELAAMSRRAGALAERERLARDIHDTIAQGLTGISMLIQSAEAETGPNRHLALAARTARESLAETRALIAASAPPALAGVPLAAALEHLVADFHLPGRTEVRGDPWTPPADVQAVVLRVAQEALANVRKHARAGSVTLTLTFGDGGVRLAVADDGTGFDPAAHAAGYGLAGMRSRVEQAGGTLAVDSAPGGGTRVEAEVPCSAC
ncbi:sensor histidine kinase [Spirillospora sp. CA-253888]